MIINIQNLLGLESNNIRDIKCNTESSYSYVSSLQENFKNKLLNKSNKISERPVKTMIRYSLNFLKEVLSIESLGLQTVRLVIIKIVKSLQMGL